MDDLDHMTIDLCPRFSLLLRMLAVKRDCSVTDIVESALKSAFSVELDRMDQVLKGVIAEKRELVKKDPTCGFRISFNYQDGSKEWHATFFANREQAEEEVERLRWTPGSSIHYGTIQIEEWK